MEILVRMEADREAWREKAEADRKAAQEELMAKLDADSKAWRERMAAERRAIEAETEAIKTRTRAIRENMGASLREMVAEATPERNMETAAAFEPQTEVNTMACQGMEALPEEEKPTSADRKPEAAEEYEVPAENAEVIPVGEPKKERRKDRKLAAEHRCQKPNTSTRDNCGPQKRLAVARRGTSHRATVALKM
jgi:hypothetical protein